MSIGAELGQYCLSTQLKNSEDSMGGSLNAPLGTLMGLPKATASGQPAEVNVWSTCQQVNSSRVTLNWGLTALSAR